MKYSQPRWHLLGAGSLGCLFAAYLRRAGIDIELILRDDETLQQLHANSGITLSNGDSRSQIMVAANTANNASAPITQLLICTKAQQTFDAIIAIKSKLAPDAIIVLLQNGMGVRELLLRELPNATILHALSTEGAFRNARFDITHAGRGETLIGAIDSHQTILAENIARALRCEIPIHFAADIERRLWLKLAVNSVINPLTAIHRCRNGELLQLDTIEIMTTQLCDELARVAQAEHINLNTAQMRDEVYRVMQATAQNKSSMLQDIEAQRSTEIDFINGFIVQRARGHGLQTAHHKQLLLTIKALETRQPAP